ncbi:hypothetical protein BDV26DRAFT_258115 [Aspergillus bertholletiae]|uniref:Uncharacterized protein n=1 Tax=Aspergillus bertholletiae TaxID=1226010 RepID=A0A5N7BE12_9EURO|nr:hypothetical protein BDV26DRAFT_258115 [Aspergillus bertholletiae]
MKIPLGLNLEFSYEVLDGVFLLWSWCGFNCSLRLPWFRSLYIWTFLCGAEFDHCVLLLFGSRYMVIMRACT